MQTEERKIYVRLTWFLNRAVRPHQIPGFRSEINHIMGWEDNRFHNHIKDTRQTEQRYPSVQFRSLKLPEDIRDEVRIHHQLGAIFSFEEGNESVQKLIESIVDTPRYDELNDGIMREQEIVVKIVAEPIRYKINHWLGLTDEQNFEIWKSPMRLHERVEFLERIIYAQIEEFCREIDLRLPPDALEVNLFDYQSLEKATFKKDSKGTINYEAFDIIYEANISLPDYIGLGKGKSKGFGWQTQTQFHELRPSLKKRR